MIFSSKGDVPCPGWTDIVFSVLTHPIVLDLCGTDTGTVVEIGKTKNQGTTSRLLKENLYGECLWGSLKRGWVDFPPAGEP